MLSIFILLSITLFNVSTIQKPLRARSSLLIKDPGRDCPKEWKRVGAKRESREERESEEERETREER